MISHTDYVFLLNTYSYRFGLSFQLQRIFFLILLTFQSSFGFMTHNVCSAKAHMYMRTVKVQRDVGFLFHM